MSSTSNLYALRCASCNELFEPVVVTNSGELLNPDYEDDSLDTANRERLRQFHDRHGSHNLEEVLVPGFGELES